MKAQRIGALKSGLVFLALLALAFACTDGVERDGVPGTGGQAGALEPGEDGGTGGSGDVGGEGGAHDPGGSGGMGGNSGVGEGELQGEFETLLHGNCSMDVPRKEARFEVIEDVEAFRRAMVESGYYAGSDEGDADLAPPPYVDFKRYVVIAAHPGLQSHCGVEFRFDSVREREDRVEVSAVLEDVCEGDDAETYPNAFARTHRVDKPYVYSLSTQRRCEE